MTIEKGVNSFVSFDEADAYFAARVGSAPWNSATDEDKEMALLTAAQLLNDMDWLSYVMDDAQPLAFPRSGSYFDASRGAEVSMEETPDRVARAQMDIANHLLLNQAVMYDKAAAASVEVGGVRVSGMNKPGRVPSSVRALLRPLLAPRGANAWFRAN